jgi:hypothetical protein
VVPDCDSWTIERRITDGTNHLDNEWAYCMANEMTLSADEDAPLMLEVNGFARRVSASTHTAALAHPTIEIPPIALSKVFIDTSWAGLGGTQVTGQVLTWSVTLRNGAQGRRTADGRTDMDFTTHLFGEAGLEAELVLLVKADSGQYATEKTAAEAQSLRAVRIQADGSSGRQVQIDFLAKHAAGSLFTVGDQDGFAVVTLNLVSATDLTNAFRVKVTNLVDTLV